MTMKTKELLNILFAVFFIAAGLTACSDDDNLSTPQFVENAKIQEEGQTLSPGQIVHLEGKGYQEGDDVILNIYWKLNEPLFPEGYIKGDRAEILTRTPDGITIRMPYRKPESRVEVMLMRGGEMMMIGEVRLKDGTTPKEVKLYGINNNLHNKGHYIDALQIERCGDEESWEHEQTSWSLEEHPDFHSVVGLWRTYGLCGLAQEEGVPYPFFFDFCTLEWKKLSDIKTIALLNAFTAIDALQTRDGKNYKPNNISANLESSNYATATTKSNVNPSPGFPLPEGLKAEQFGEYPGAFTDKHIRLFSANKGNGKWTPVIYDMYSGFYALDDIDADGLIPFSFPVRDEKVEITKKKWIFGYIVAREKAENGSEFYLLNDNPLSLQQEPFAVFPNRAVSISSNLNKPGTFTVHFEAYRNGNITCEYSWETKEWKDIHHFSGHTHDEIIWAN